MDKMIKNGAVAVLTSANYGGGYSTCGEDPFDPRIVAAVLDGWVTDLYVTWVPVGVPVGVRFQIREYDGREWIETEDEQQWLTA